MSLPRAARDGSLVEAVRYILAGGKLSRDEERRLLARVDALERCAVVMTMLEALAAFEKVAFEGTDSWSRAEFSREQVFRMAQHSVDQLHAAPGLKRPPPT